MSHRDHPGHVSEHPLRLDANNVTDGERRRTRQRFGGSLVLAAPVVEYDNNGNITGPQYLLTMRKTFQ